MDRATIESVLYEESISQSTSKDVSDTTRNLQEKLPGGLSPPPHHAGERRAEAIFREDPCLDADPLSEDEILEAILDSDPVM